MANLTEKEKWQVAVVPPVKVIHELERWRCEWYQPVSWLYSLSVFALCVIWFSAWVLPLRGRIIDSPWWMIAAGIVWIHNALAATSYFYALTSADEIACIIISDGWWWSQCVGMLFQVVTGIIFYLGLDWFQGRQMRFFLMRDVYLLALSVSRWLYSWAVFAFGPLAYRCYLRYCFCCVRFNLSVWWPFLLWLGPEFFDPLTRRGRFALWLGQQQYDNACEWREAVSRLSATSRVGRIRARIFARFGQCPHLTTRELDVEVDWSRKRVVTDLQWRFDQGRILRLFDAEDLSDFESEYLSRLEARKPLKVKSARRLAREAGRREDQERRRALREKVSADRDKKLSLREGVEPLAGDEEPKLEVTDAGFFTVYKDAPLFRLMTAFGSLFGGAVVGAGSSYVAKAAFRAVVSGLGLPENLCKEFDKVIGGPALAAAVEQIGELLMDVYSAANSPQELWTALITPTGPTLASLCARVRAAQFMAEAHGVAGVEVLEKELYQLTTAVQRRHMSGVAVSWHLGTAVSSLIDSAEALITSLRASQIVRPPFGLHFVGPAGSGKTQLMELVMTHMSSFGSGTPDPSVLGTINPKANHDDGLSSRTKILSFDDSIVTQGKEAAQALDTFINMVAQLMRGTPYLANKAALEDKGRHYVSPHFVCWAANLPFSGLMPHNLIDSAQTASRFRTLKVEYTDDKRVVDAFTRHAENFSLEQCMEDGRVVSYGCYVKNDQGAWAWKNVKTARGWPEIKALVYEVIADARTHSTKPGSHRLSNCLTCCEPSASCKCPKVKAKEPLLVSQAAEASKRLEQSGVKVEPLGDEPVGGLSYGIVTIMAALVCLLVLYGVDADRQTKLWNAAKLAGMCVACCGLPTLLVGTVLAFDVAFTAFLWVRIPRLVWWASLSTCVLTPAYKTLVETVWLWTPAWMSAPIVTLFGWRQQALRVLHPKPLSFNLLHDRKAFRATVLALLFFLSAMWVRKVFERTPTPTAVPAAVSAKARKAAEEYWDGVPERVAEPECEEPEALSGNADDAVAPLVLPVMSTESPQLPTPDFTLEPVVLKKRRQIEVPTRVELGPKSKTASFDDVARSLARRVFSVECQGVRSSGCFLAPEVLCVTAHGSHKGSGFVRVPSGFIRFELPEVEKLPVENRQLQLSQNHVLVGDVALVRTFGATKWDVGDWLAKSREDVDLLFGSDAIVFGAVSGRVGPFTFCRGDLGPLRGLESRDDTVGTLVKGDSGGLVLVRYGTTGVLAGTLSARVGGGFAVNVVCRDTLTLMGPDPLSLEGVADTDLLRDHVYEDLGKGAWVRFVEGASSLRGEVLCGAPKSRPRPHWTDADHPPPGDDALWPVRQTRGLRFSPMSGAEPLRPSLVVGTSGGRPVEFYSGTDMARVAAMTVPNPPAMDRASYEYVGQVFAARLGPRPTNFPIDVLTFEQAAFGSDWCDMVRGSSSAGPGRVGKVKDFIKTDPASHWFDPKLKAMSDEIVSNWLDGKLDVVSSCAILKAEQRPYTKLYARTIYMVDLATNMALKRLFAPLFYLLAARRMSTGFSTTVNAASLEFAKSMKMKHGGRRCMDADVADMDVSHTHASMFMLACMFAAIPWLSDRLKRAMKAALFSLYEPVVAIDGVLLSCSVGLVTGSWVTSLLNTMFVFGCMALSVGVSPHMDDSQWRSDQQGDDSVFSLDPAVEGFTPRDLAAGFEAMGLGVTGSDKKPLGTVWKPFEALTFLKRDFLPAKTGCRSGLPRMALPSASLVRSLWRVEGPFTWLRLASTVANAWKETLLFDESDVMLQPVRAYLVARAAECSARGVPVTLMSRVEFERRLLAGDFQTFDSA